MPEHTASDAMAPAPATPDTPSSQLTSILARAMTPDPVALAAGFGRWWLDPGSERMALSREAAALLGAQPGPHPRRGDCLAFVLAEDLPSLNESLARAGAGVHPLECQFRVASKHEGLRWVRLVALAPDPRRQASAIEGILTDITAVKHAAMREQFSFESTQLLIGTHTLGEAVTKVIELVCTDLGWDCGMYWSLRQDGPHAGRLVCAHHWSGPSVAAIDALPGTDDEHGIAPGQGLIGGVWSSGQPRWIEDVGSDPEFLFPRRARQSGLLSGYAFPVAYDSGDGRRHRPGVLAFFSCLARQRAAQLPNLSAAIGGLIAQTAQRIAQQESIRHLAQTDTLSGLTNRRHFHELLDAACLDAGRRGATLAVLYIDLDRFKPINDALGHEVGDAVLRQFSQRLAGLTPPDGQAGRVGGDEFALFLATGDSPGRLEELADLILQAARTRFVVGGRELAISASVGISLFPDNGASGAELLRHADSAMYRVKRSGRNSVSFFSHVEQTPATSQTALMRQLMVETELIDALADGQLFMHYQPVFGARDRQLRAVEALIRWRRPDGELVPPDAFIPIAERSHLIVDIGRWVIRQACRDLALLHRHGLPGVQMNVNMTALEFLNVNLPNELASLAAAEGVAPRHLCLELTEGMMMKHADQVIPVMRDLRRRGFKISIDDFGMAYSSLSRLKDLPISSLKIDRSFVHGLPHGAEDCAIVQTIVDIGRNMRLDVVAEGVENTAQLEHLSALGCTLIQGYLMGRPMPPLELIRTHGNPASIL